MKKVLSGALTLLIFSVSSLMHSPPINAAVTIIQLATPTVVTLDQKTVTLVPPVSNSPGTWSVEIDNPSIATADGLKVTLLNVGTSVIRYVQAASGEYNASSKHSRLTINPGIPTLGNFNNQSVNLIQNTFNLTPPTSTSDGPWTFESLNTNIATISGRTVTLKDGGEVKIRATQGITNKWAAATAEMTLTINAATPTLGSFSNIALSIDSVSRVQLNFPSSNSKGAWSLQSSDPSVVAIDGTYIVAKRAGIATITAYQAPAGGYRSASTKMTVTITAVTPTITSGDFKDATIELDPGATKILTLKAPISNSTGAWALVSSNSSIATINGFTLNALKPGTIKVTATQAASGNFGETTLPPITIKILGKQNLLAPSAITKLVGDPSFKITFPISMSTGNWSAKSSDIEVVTISDNNINFVGAGKSIITLTQEATDSYVANSVTFEVTVIGLTPTLGTFNPISIGVGESLTGSQLPTSNSKGRWVLTSSDPTIANVVNGSLVGLKVGSTLISAYQVPSGKYGQSNTLQSTLTVKPQPTSAEFAELKILLGTGVKQITLPLSNSAGAWTFTSLNPQIASVNGSTVVPVATGTTTIIATQLPTANFSGITKKFNVTVGPAPLPKASANLSGRIINISLSNPLGAVVDVRINTAVGKVGKNPVLPGTRTVTVRVGGKLIYSKSFKVR